MTTVTGTEVEGTIVATARIIEGRGVEANGTIEPIAAGSRLVATIDTETVAGGMSVRRVPAAAGTGGPHEMATADAVTVEAARDSSPQTQVEFGAGRFWRPALVI